MAVLRLKIRKKAVDERHVVLKSGDSASTYKIRLHDEYNFLFDGGYPSSPVTNEFVLKTYSTEDAKKYYSNEVNAFKRLMHRNKVERNMITFYGSFRQGRTYNILLEYANKGTLVDFFEETRPPIKEADITKFWSNLLEIIKPLQRIHELKREDGPLIL
ncbi:hypothetical protein K469DRAFT_746459 [Zopfia rhizophila CBS 207.26]|uniref:Protein kinase domain-containing protein n=1 Tax=Zopfia rhizophila CBS 207.26 TaxID=1314779 RepID=A0A6A6EIT0_9PEZI|nr:hypothetical protein K469DRAFT_746459 [Zopfia rhizophila CBS 207.26]